MNDRIALRPAEVGKALGFSRSKTYELISAGTIPSVRVGKSVRVPVAALNEWLQRQVEAGAEVSVASVA